jgi:sugar/nucleoside kinase (ribokinase family)
VLRHLVVGHVCWDELADGRVLLGGTAFYAAAQANSLGCAVTVQTACTQPLAEQVRSMMGPKVSVRVTGSDVDTRYAFESDPQDGPTRLLARATVITAVEDDVHADSAHIAPIADETSAEVIRSVRQRVAFLGMTPQGLMRVFSSGVLRRDTVQAVPLLSLADAIVVNEAEYDLLLQVQPELVERSTVDLFVTRGPRGASLFRGGTEVARREPPPVRTESSSSVIGAGDVFASTVFVGLARGGAGADVLADAIAAASAFVSRPAQAQPAHLVTRAEHG